MYRHCIFCNSDLGDNEIVEALPIGRRVAFDAAKGRLWVVCAKCERWNLTPFDARWEAIEECERRFRDTRLRVSTDNIGLARASEGLELVRIGEPLRPEMAAWRYGDQFGRRRRRHAYVAGAVVAGIGAVAAGVSAIGVGIGGFAGIYGNVYQGLLDRVQRIRVPAPDGELTYLVPSKAQKARVWFEPGTHELGLSVKLKSGLARYHGEEARAMASIVLPRANIAGAGADHVKQAVDLIATTPGGDETLYQLLGDRAPSGGKELGLSKLGKPTRLALEMALHEEEERRALMGELKELELRWQAAEEIAAIADSLTIPDSVDEQFKHLKRRSDSSDES